MVLELLSMTPEKLGVPLDDFPQWAADAAIASQAIDFALNAIVEDERLEKYGAPSVRERQQALIRVKNAARDTARALLPITGQVVFPKGVWNEDQLPLFKNAPPEEKSEFYRRHVENMKRRVGQLARALISGGKGLPKEIVILRDTYALVLSVKDMTLSRAPVRKAGLSAAAFGPLDLKRKELAQDADWFSVRWDTQLLKKAKGLSRTEMGAITAKVHLE